MISHRHSRSSKSSLPKTNGTTSPHQRSSSSSLLPTSTTTTTTIARSSHKTSNYWLLPPILILTFIITNVRSTWRDYYNTNNASSNTGNNRSHGKFSNDDLTTLEEEDDDEPYHNSAAICVIQKGALRYIDEWVYYNLLAIGFDHIYFFDNSDNFELEEWHANLNNNQVVANYDDNRTTLQQRISIQHFPGINRQNEAYTICAKRIQASKAHSWIAFVDVDEFLKEASEAIDDPEDLAANRIPDLAFRWRQRLRGQSRRHQNGRPGVHQPHPDHVASQPKERHVSKAQDPGVAPDDVHRDSGKGKAERPSKRLDEGRRNKTLLRHERDDNGEDREAHQKDDGRGRCDLRAVCLRDFPTARPVR